MMFIRLQLKDDISLYLNVCGNAGDVPMDEDEILSKITRLLERGCTMLATHHDCGAPLFRCQGEIVCPICSFPDKPDEDEFSPAGREESILSSTIEDKTELKQSAAIKALGGGSLISGKEVSSADEGMDREVAEAKSRLRASLIARLDEVSISIRSEGDLDRLKKLLDCAEGLLSMLRSL